MNLARYRLIWYALFSFLLHGLLYGGLLGFITGTLIVPLIGTAFATVWSLGMGLVLGLFGGVIVAALVWMLPITVENARIYRRALPMGMGALISVAAGLLLHVSSAGLLWNSYVYSPAPPEYTPYYLSSILSAFVWAGVAAAYTAHRFVEFCAVRLSQRSKAVYLPETDKYPDDHAMYWVSQFASCFAIYPVMAVAGALIRENMMQAYYVYYVQLGQDVEQLSSNWHYVAGGVAGIVYALYVSALLGVVNGLALQFINRVVVHEYFPDLPRERYKTWVSVACGVGTTLLGVMLAVGMLAPQPGALLAQTPSVIALVVGLLAAAFGGLMAGRIAGDYADHYYDGKEAHAEEARTATAPMTPLTPANNGRVQVLHRHVSALKTADQDEIEPGIRMADEPGTVNRALQ